MQLLVGRDYGSTSCIVRLFSSYYERVNGEESEAGLYIAWELKIETFQFEKSRRDIGKCAAAMEQQTCN